MGQSLGCTIDGRMSSILLQRNLRIGPHNDVWILGALSLASPLLLPQPLHGQSSEMDSLAGPSGCGSYRSLPFRNLPHVCNHRDASGMDCHHRRVFVCICQVLADVFQEELIRSRLHVRVHERSEIEVRASIKVEFVLDELVHRRPVCSAVRYLKLWDVDAGLITRSIRVVARVVGSGVINVGSLGSGAFLEMADELIWINLVVIVSNCVWGLMSSSATDMFGQRHLGCG